MSVKAENRPENRFIVLTNVNNLQDEILNTVKADAIPEEFRSTIFEDIVAARTSVLTFNACDVFSTTFFALRAKHQAEALKALNHLKCTLELYVLQVPLAAKPLTLLFRSANHAMASLKHLMDADDVRHAKGKAKVEQEYAEARKHDFFVKQTYDHSKTDPKLLKNADPFGISKLVFEAVKEDTES